MLWRGYDWGHCSVYSPLRAQATLTYLQDNWCQIAEPLISSWAGTSYLCRLQTMSLPNETSLLTVCKPASGKWKVTRALPALHNATRKWLTVQPRFYFPHCVTLVRAEGYVLWISPGFLQGSPGFRPGFFSFSEFASDPNGLPNALEEPASRKAKSWVHSCPCFFTVSVCQPVYR